MRTLADDVLAPGPHELRWNGRDDTGRCLASGVYLVRLKQTGRVRARKIVLLK